MDRLEFAQAVARIRVLEKRLLDKSNYEQLIGLNSEKEWVRWLQDRNYSPLLSAIDQGGDPEKTLNLILASEYELLKSISPEPQITSLLGLKYDYHNLMVLIKSKLGGEARTDLCAQAGNLPPSALQRDLERGALRDWPEQLSLTAAEALRQFERNRDPLELDWIITRSHLSHMLSEVEIYNSDFIKDWVLQKIDLYHLTVLLGGQKRGDPETDMDERFVPGGRLDKAWLHRMYREPVESLLKKLAHTDFGGLLKVCSNALADGDLSTCLADQSERLTLAKLQAASRISFGPEPLFSYLLNKEAEIRNLRMILLGFQVGSSADEIMERLRMPDA